MRLYKFTVLCLLFISFSSSEVNAQLFKKKSKEEPAKKVSAYEKLVSGAKKDEGVFNVFQKGDKYYFEIPESYFGKDFLWVSRISKIPADLGGGYLNAGSKTNEQVVRWEKVDKKILLKSISFSSFSNDTLPIYQSVVNNSFDPVIVAFDVDASNKKNSSVVIDVSSLFNSDIAAISGLPSRLRGAYKVRNLDRSRSYVESVRSFPENIEMRHVMTYNASSPPSNSRTGTISMEMAQSMYLLPSDPTMPRLFDQRVGWFTLSKIDYGSDELKADKKTYIRRWRLEPKDPEAYARGELVEPVKPIIYYLDPATPTKWLPYFKKGIEDWQVAFEAAGFKNAIIAMEAPSKEEDPDWSPEDARYSTVRYVATTTRNAMGPSVTDPRSGEIIESDIVWYHNHLRSYRNRYMLETGAANPKARTLDTPEEEIGEMMRMVISHEIGHALGLPHNMKASYAYPTDSLRSATFTQKWGLASTLMDYTRYNYVAQPGDEGVRWVRMLGPYDSYAINYGYRVIPSASTPEEELETLRSWIKEKEGNPIYLFGDRSRSDPSSQTEAVGDDPVKASSYGLSNIKIVAENLYEWTTQDGEDYEDLEELYGELIGVWNRYAAHVTAVVGGVYELRRTSDQPGTTYTHVSKSEQKEAMDFLLENVFVTPDWLLQKEIIQNIGASGTVKAIASHHDRHMRILLDDSRLLRMVENETFNAEDAYTLTAMLNDLRSSVWSDISSGRSVNAYERNIQRAHVKALTSLLADKNVKDTDVAAAARAELIKLESLSNRMANRYPDDLTKYHLADIAAQIAESLDMDE